MTKLFTEIKTYLAETQILESEVFLLSNGKWLLLFTIIFSGLALQKLVQILWPLIFRFTARTLADWDDHLVKVSKPYAGRVVAGLFWYGAFRAADFGTKLEHGFSIAARLYISINIILLVYYLIDVLMGVIQETTRKKDLPIDHQVLALLHKTLKVFVIIFGFLVMIQNFGVNVVSLLAGLGLGGLAFALAAQDTCANFFGSIMILTDKPFRVGDMVKVGSNEGTVEDIGFRSTKIRTAYGSLITIPNAEMAKASIDNMGARSENRLRFQLGLEYDTKPEKMKTFINEIKQIIEKHPKVNSDNYVVAFENYGDFSLNILVNCFLQVSNIREELAVKEEILFAIYHAAENVQVSFAFPTQTLHLPKAPQS